MRSLSPMHTLMSWERIDELGGTQWPCNDEDPAARCSSTNACGGSTIRSGRVARRRSRVVDRRPAGRRALRRVPDPAHDRAAARVVQHGRADRRLHVAPATAGRRSTCRPRMRRRSVSRTGELRPVISRRGCGRGAGAHDDGAPAGTRLHDVPLPGAGRDEQDHDRGHRPEIRDLRVQGHGDPRGEARARAGDAGWPAMRGPQAHDGGAVRRGTCRGRRGARRARDRPGRRRSERARPAGLARGPRSGRRTLLLPVLHALQERVGWISEGGLNYVCERLQVPPAEAYGVATFYACSACRSARRRSSTCATTSRAG